MAKWRETLLLQTTNMKFFTWFALVCCVAHRLDNFVVGLTNVDPSKTPPVFKSSYRVCGQYGGRVAVAANATDGSEISFRHRSKLSQSRSGNVYHRSLCICL